MFLISVKYIFLCLVPNKFLFCDESLIFQKFYSKSFLLVRVRSLFTLTSHANMSPVIIV